MLLDDHIKINECYANAATDISLEVNESYSTNIMPMKANECYGTAADIPLEVNESYGTKMPIKAHECAADNITLEVNDSYSTNMPIKTNECYGITVADAKSNTIPLSPSQCHSCSASERNADAVYAQVQEGIKDEYDYVIN